MNKNNPPLILVDGSSYLYRAFHGLPPLTTAKGEPTGAVYGVINMLRKLIKDYAPEQMVVVFDAKGKTFRDDLYAEYKANRPAMPDELRVQIQPLHDIVKGMGLPLLSIEGYEADDVIGTLATQAAQNGQEVLVSTGDKDLAQLVTDKITLINTMTNKKLNPAGVQEKFGVPPELIIDYLALMGDSSDNIPGVPSVGPKTAAKWLNEYGSLDAIVENADNIKGKVGEKLRASLAQLPLSKALTTICCDMSLDMSLDDLNIKEKNTEQLQEWFTRFEFRAWLKELSSVKESGDEIDFQLTASDNASEGTTKKVSKAAGKKTGKAAAASPALQNQIETSYDMIVTEAQLQTWLKRLKKAPLFAFDTETTSLNYMQAEIVGVSFAIQAGEAAYIPLAHTSPDAPEQLSRDTVLQQLKPLLESEDKKIIGQHLKYDRNVLLNYDIHLNAIAHDTMLESYVLDSVATRHDMDSLAKKYLDKNTIHYEDIAGKGVKQITFDQVDVAQATQYAAEDADITLQLHQVLHEKLASIPSLASVYNTIEMPLVKVLSAIERTGVLVDAAMLKKQSKALSKRMLEVQTKIFESAGEAFNLASPKQIQHILFEKQGLPVIRKTPKGQPSTAEDVLEELANQGHELPTLIVEHRGLSKLISTYTDRLPEQIDPNTKRIHTSYHQAVASTGRLSSTDPNLQNIPIKNEEGRRIRQAFIPPKGYKLLAADYSQIELRIMAHLSEDKSLLNAFQQGLDVHRATAAEVFGLEPETVSSEQRRAAKAINFGLIYGMSAFGLAKQLGISRSEAQDYVNLYFERYPGVKGYMDDTRSQAREQGYVETVFGRRLYLPEINSRNAPRRQYAERTAINAPMQGTAADIIKLAMIAVHGWLTQEHADTRIIMQVHDELVLEVPEGKVTQIKEGITEYMVNVAELSVPLEVDVGVGDNWDEAH